MYVCMHVFIHSFIPAISIAPLQVLYYSEALPTTARIAYCIGVSRRSAQVCMYVSMYVCMYVCMYAFMYVCIFVYLNILACQTFRDDNNCSSNIGIFLRR